MKVKKLENLIFALNLILRYDYKYVENQKKGAKGQVLKHTGTNLAPLMRVTG